MKNSKNEAIWLGVSIACFGMMALSFLFMPLEKVTFWSGAVFWMGLAGGIVTQVVVSSSRKAFFRKNRISYKNSGKARVGLLRVFANLPAQIADVACAVGLVGTVISLIATKGYGYVCYVFISLTVFSFVLHCIFNGRNFDFVLNKKKICSILNKRYKQNLERGEEKK